MRISFLCAQGYKLHAQLTVEEFGMTREFMPGVRERIDFGELQVKETRSVKLRLKNKGPPPGTSLLPINFDFIVQVKSGRGPVVLGPTMGMSRRALARAVTIRLQ